MKKYTKKDLETFERNEQGWLICPSGDYTAIKGFPGKCTFGSWSKFGDGCNFGQWCNLGDDCSVGSWCKFGLWNSFGRGCIFGEKCNFGERCYFGQECNFGLWCIFGEKCIFGDGCKFGDGSKFGERCRFGEWCIFCEGCSHEGLTNSIYVAVDRIGSELRKTYFFKAEEGYFVRAGCFFGTLDKFKTKVHETHGGTIHEKTYRMACKLAVKLLDSQWK